MIGLLRARNFRLLWLGGLISLAGDWALVVALPFEVYRRTGSTLATAGIVLASLLPAFLFGSVAGVFVDRWNRRSLMVWVNLAMAASLAPLLLVDALGIWVVYAALVVATLLKQLFLPAEVALLPQLVGQGDLVAANSLSSLNRNLARLIGPAIGGATVALGGLTLVVIVDAASFIGAAVLIALIPASVGARATVHEAVQLSAATLGKIGRMTADLRSGFSHVLTNPGLRALLAFSFITSLGEGVLGALFVPWVSDVLHGDDTAYAALLSAQAAGGIAGAFVVGQFFGHTSARMLLAVGAILFGLIDLALFLYPVLLPIILPAIIGMVLVGLPTTAIHVGHTTLQQTLTSDSHRGRAIGLFGAVMALGMVIGTSVAGLLGESLGILPLLVIQGAGYIVGGLVVGVGVRDPEPEPQEVRVPESA